jgi:hypothetical protein
MAAELGTAGSNGSYVVDRRGGARKVVAASLRPGHCATRWTISSRPRVPPRCAAGYWSCATPIRRTAFPREAYETIVAGKLAEYVRGPDDGRRALEAARRLREAGARAVAVTRAEAPILVLPDDGQPYEIVPPAFREDFARDAVSR